VPFRESVADERTGWGSASTANKQGTLRVRAQCLPERVLAAVQAHHHSLRAAQLRGRSWLREGELEEPVRVALGEVRAALRGEGGQWADARPLGIAPLSDCTNLLLCDAALVAASGDAEGELAGLLSSLVSGFQLAAGSGPLCEEPMSGVAFTIEELGIEPAADDGDGTAQQPVANGVHPVGRRRPICPPGVSWGSGRSCAPRSAA
jgi:translation elongation factor EF-G